MRLGAFHKQLVAWTGKPVALTMHVVWGHGPLVVTGVLRPDFAAGRLRGWVLVPPDAFGGTEFFRITALELRRNIRRTIGETEAGAVRLRYWTHPDVMFDLELLPDAAWDEAQRNIRAS